ncbi:MAG: multicopper oxidase domain-containing protein [Deltaproteobacteria bacterium]|nr:multicopper oxidase domain-containing protein [Deltaproteobacteria bacterium]
MSAAGGAASVFARAYGATCVDQSPIGIDAPAPGGGTMDNTGCPIDADLNPMSPFILEPFTDPLPVPTAMKPGYRRPDGTLAPAGAQDEWSVRAKRNDQPSGRSVPGYGPGYQDAIGERLMPNDGRTFTFINPKTGIRTTKTMDFGGARAGSFQLYPGGRGTSYGNLSGQAKARFDLLATDPVLYHIRIGVSAHAFTSSNVQPIDRNGRPVPLPRGVRAPNGSRPGTFKMPASTIYGFNNTFGGTLCNVEYGRPVIVRMENDLDLNPSCLDRGDFGAPDWAFLTHLHNGHTAPECDGQPHHLMENEGGYLPTEWSDNLYLNYPAGGLDEEKQSFLWFHDHRMHHTGPNVYKGMLGLMPHYDPANANNPTGIDSGDERTGLRLPGVRVDNGDGTFDVKYDVPMALYDCRMDDGVTPHEDAHTPLPLCGLTHPESWGQLFLKHYPNHGFVGDIFTVNGVAYPVLHVERRRYRFRFLGASLARQYQLSLRRGSIVPAPGRQGQWSFGTQQGGKTVFDSGQQVMRMTQIASDGGLLPRPVLRDSVEIWPAKRREVVIDFSTYQDGSATRNGDVIYLTNSAEMIDGRQISSKDRFFVPMVAFVIDGEPSVADASDPGLSPTAAFNPSKQLRPRITPPPNPAVNHMDFTLQRGGSLGGETEWLINGLQFDPQAPLWAPKLDSFEFWGVNNGGGGWTHPMHIHMEEHQVTARSTGLGMNARPPHPEDPIGKEDVVALEPSEQTTIYRGFRTFLGNYVAHCHNLAHEDHNMMFGWAITK